MELEKSIYWTLLNGIIISNSSGDGSVVHAPYSLKPYKYPSTSFYYAQNLSIIFNKLVHKVSNNSIWLLKVLENVRNY